MLEPGKIFINTEVRFTASFTDSSGAAVNPTTVKFRAFSPSGVDTTLTYGDDPEVLNPLTGSFTADFTPDQAGHWYYRWESTGTGTTTAREGRFNVQYSPFFDPPNRAYAG